MKLITDLYTGRMNRINFFYGFVALKLIDFLFYKTYSVELSSVILVVGIIQVLLGSTIATKRLHDFGFSGWYSILFLIPVIGFFVGIGLLITKGDGKANKYGDVPK